MEILEKILEEIRRKGVEISHKHWEDDELHLAGKLVQEMCVQSMNIIRKYMDDIPKCSECSRRKFYQNGYEDGKRDDGWIPCSERLPNNKEYLKDDGRFILDDGNRRYQGYFDYNEGTFKFERHISGIIPEFFEDKCVIAWQPLPKKYKGEK